MSDLTFITTYNPALPNICNIIQNNLSILHTDENMKKNFPSKTIRPSLFSAKHKNSESCITSCKKCDICKNYLITDNKFKCKVTGRFYDVEAICLVTAIMPSTLFLVKTVKINTLDQPLISRSDLEFIKLT